MNRHVLGDLISFLPQCAELHGPGTPIYDFLQKLVSKEVRSIFLENSGDRIDLGSIGAIHFPLEFLGGDKTSIDLLVLDEIILFAFYASSREKYSRVLDLGANIGLHSIVLGRLGFQVRAFEPDPLHTNVLKNNICRNGLKSIEVVEAAISVEDGEAEFIRVGGNTTSSHIAGEKRQPYGELEHFQVRTADFRPHFAWADFVKMDVEGHEASIVEMTNGRDWQNLDAMIEVGTEENASRILLHATRNQLQLRSQKTGWALVRSIEDMPFSYRDGSLFITGRDCDMWPRSCSP